MAESMDLAATRELAAHRAELPEDPRSRAEFLALTTPTPSTLAGGRHG